MCLFPWPGCAGCSQGTEKPPCGPDSCVVPGRAPGSSGPWRRRGAWVGQGAGEPCASAVPGQWQTSSFCLCAGRAEAGWNSSQLGSLEKEETPRAASVFLPLALRHLLDALCPSVSSVVAWCWLQGLSLDPPRQGLMEEPGPEEAASGSAGRAPGPCGPAARPMLAGAPRQRPSAPSSPSQSLPVTRCGRRVL